MIPLRSSERTYTPATVTLLLIVVNVLVFLYELSLGLNSRHMNHFIMTYGVVPDQLRPVTVITSMFIHGGFLHILGNMWFFWIFGRGVEDILGHAKFLFFYFACGIAAAAVHILVNANSPVPTVGASGAIVGVMGAYLIKFPRARIVTLIFIFFFFTTVDIPAAFLLLYWFAIQFFSGVGSVGYSQASSGDVAWFAHIGGFLAGMGLVMLMAPRQPRYQQWS
jgi:membrane associated rhomboid family serine protease